MHNKARQHNLALEEAWVTSDGNFRQWTTFIGITLTDLWYLRNPKTKRDENNKARIVEFAKNLIWSLLKKAQIFSPVDEVVQENPQNGINWNDMSGMTSVTSVSHPHTRYYLSKIKI